MQNLKAIPKTAQILLLVKNWNYCFSKKITYKVIDIQSGGGKLEETKPVCEKDHLIEELHENSHVKESSDSDANSSDSSTSSSVSIDFTNEKIDIDGEIENEIKTETDLKGPKSTESNKEPPSKKLKTYNWDIIE